MILKEEESIMIKGLHTTNGSIFSDDNSNFGYEEFIALLEETAYLSGAGHAPS